MIKKYRKKPIVISAIKFTGNNCKAILDWLGEKAVCGAYLVLIYTLEGVMRAKPGDYIIKGINGEFYPCKPDIFEKTYEEIR